MDPLVQSVMEKNGFKTVDEAINHIKTIAAAEEAAKENKKTGDSQLEEKAKKAIDDVVEKITAGLDKKGKEHAGKTPNFEGDPDTGEVQQLKMDVWMLGHVLQRQPKNLDPDKIIRAYKIHEGRDFKMASVRKALDTTDASAIVPTELQRQMLTYVENASVILDNFRVVNMPSNPWESPYQSSSATGYGVGESTDDTASAVKASDPGVSKITFTANKIGARALWSRELDEDSAIAILPLVREDFIRVTRDCWERAFIFGDETETNQNINNYGTTPTTAAGQRDYWLQTDGMVHHCLINNTGQASDVNAAITGKKFLTVRKLLSKYGDKAQDLFALMNRDLMYDVMGLDEFKTIDKFGPKATVLTGEIGKIYGTPSGISDGLPSTDANGRIDDDSSNNTKKSLVVASRIGVIIGRRNEMRLMVDTINKTDQYEGVVFSRYDIQYPRTQALAYGYNIT